MAPAYFAVMFTTLKLVKKNTVSLSRQVYTKYMTIKLARDSPPSLYHHVYNPKSTVLPSHHSS